MNEERMVRMCSASIHAGIHSERVIRMDDCALLSMFGIDPGEEDRGESS